MALRLPGAEPTYQGPIRQGPSRAGWAGLGVVTLAIALLWVAIGLTIQAHFRNDSNLALRETANLAQILELQVAGKIDAIDATLRFGQTLFAQDPAGFRLGPWSVVGSDPAAINAILVGPDGFARADRGGPLAQPVDLRGRPNTVAHLADPTTDRLEISPPIQGLSSDRRIIAFSRPLRTAQGNFGGIMILAVDAGLFARLYHTLNLRDGRILLVGLDGLIRARVPEPEAGADGSLPDSQLEPFRQGVVQVTEYRLSAMDGTGGFVTRRRVAGYPLVVTVRLAAGTVLAASRLYRLQWLGIGTLLTLAICGFCWALARKREVERRARAALEGTFAHVGHGIMMVDPEGRVVLANARATEMLGLPPGLAVPGRPLEEIIRWQEANGEYGGRAPDPHFASQAPTADGKPYIWERTRPDGTVLEIRVDHLPDGGYVRSWTDVTEARRSAAATAAVRDTAQAARAALYAAFENAPLGIILMSADRKLEIMNGIAVDLLGLPPDLSRPGTSGSEILRFQVERGDFGTTPRLEQIIRQAENKVLIFDEAYERPARDGRMMEVRGRRLADGRVIRTYTDISARHAALHEQQAARTAAEAALRSRSEFLATVSHELRTPLHAVIGFAEVLTLQQPTPAQADSIREIELAGRALLALVDDMLDVAGLERGRFTLRETAFDPSVTLREVAVLAAARAAARGLDFRLALDAALPAEALGDAERLRQVLVKLLDNAVKFTSSGSITLGARIMAEDAGGWRLGITVTDTGIGIPAEARDRLFAPFTQADSSNARRYNGAGLGLAVARMVAEAMGGQITVESEPGRGSSFQVQLPLRRRVAVMA